MNVGALGQRDLPAFEIGKRLDGRIPRDEDRFAPGRRRLYRHIDEGDARGLGENRRSFAGVTKIDRARIERFKQRRARRKFPPFDSETERREPAFKPSPGLEQNQVAVFLKAYGDGFIGRRAGAGQKGAGDPEENRDAGNDPHHESLTLLLCMLYIALLYYFVTPPRAMLPGICAVMAAVRTTHRAGLREPGNRANAAIPPTPPGSPTNGRRAGMELTRSITSVATSSIDRLKWGFDPIHSAVHRFAEGARHFAKRGDLIDNTSAASSASPQASARVDFATALSVWTEQVFGQAGLTSPAIRGVSTLPATSSRKCPYPTFIQRFYSRLRHSLRSSLAYDCGQIG